MSDRCRLQAIEFVEGAVDASVGDEVVDVVVFGGYAGFIGDEWRAAGEGVVGVADEVGVGEGFAAEL